MSLFKNTFLIFSLIAMFFLMGCGKATELSSIPSSEQVSEKDKGAAESGADPYLEEQVVESDEFQAEQARFNEL